MAFLYIKRSKYNENLCDNDSFFKAFNSIAAKGHKSETFNIIFLFFNDNTKTEIKESTNGGD